MSERDLQNMFRLRAHDVCKDVRVFVRTVGTFMIFDAKTQKARPFRAGLKGQCDLYGMIKGKTGRASIHIEIECKTDKGRLRPEQVDWKNYCESWGIPWLLLQGRKEETEHDTINRWLVEYAEFVNRARFGV